jgi:drug/metabolite transporter (DMT)-like permease
MSSIIALTSFFTAVLFYLIYKEKLYVRHLLGMLSLLVCLIFIAISKETNISFDALTH